MSIKIKKINLYIYILTQVVFIYNVNAQDLNNFKSVSYSVFDAVNPEVFYKENERIIIKQIVYSNYEFTGNKHLLDSEGIAFEYCDFLNKESFKYKYILCTEIDLNKKNSFEYILKEDNKDIEFEKLLFFKIEENNDLLSSCIKNPKEKSFFSNSFQDFDLYLTKCKKNYYINLCSRDCSICDKQIFNKVNKISFAYVGEGILIQINDSTLQYFFEI